MMKVLILLHLKKYIIAIYSNFKIILVIFAFLLFGLNLKAQNSTSDVYTVACPSNYDSLKIEFIKIIDLNGVSTFKLKSFCPNPLAPHDSLDVDSINIKILVNSDDIMIPTISVELDSSLNYYYNSTNLDINNAIDIDIAFIDEGRVLSDAANLTNDGISGEVIKVFIDVYEGISKYEQPNLEMDRE